MITKVDDNAQYEVVVTYNISGKEVNDYLKKRVNNHWYSGLKALIATAVISYKYLEGSTFSHDNDTVVMDKNACNPTPPVKVHREKMVMDRIEITKYM